MPVGEDKPTPTVSGVVKPATRPQTAVVKTKMNSESKAPAIKSVQSSA